MQLSKLSRFNEFFQLLNEAYMPILDAVIDENGIVYNGEGRVPLIKGRVERIEKGAITRILGTDGKNYPAGIDKNGRVHAIRWEDDDDGAAFDFSGKPILVPQNIARKYKLETPYYYTSPEYDYYDLVPKIATGWVNVKIDMEIVKRVRRYARSLGRNKTGHSSFADKLKDFEDLSSTKSTRTGDALTKLKRRSIQKEMSCILLLHYINEIKDFFHPSSSGFLFESFIAGLIPDSRIKEDNSPVDIISPHGRYQCKLIDWKDGYVDVTRDLPPNRPILEWYLIARKFVDRIEILVINGDELNQRIEKGNLDGIITKGGIDKKTNQRKPGSFSVSKINSNVDGKFISKFTIDLTDIEGRINNLGESLKSQLDGLYDELSSFQYNVESIITGVDQKGKMIRGQSGFDKYHTKAEENIRELAVHLSNLVGEINK